MSFGATKLLSASGGKAYEIDQSLMCSSGDASKLRRTPSSEGNRKTFTFSSWCKRASIGGHQYLMGAFVSAGGSTNDSHYFSFGFNSVDEVAVGVWTQNYRYSNRKFRDTAAWYHLLLQVDTTQGTADDRIKIYINGVQETSFHTNNNPSQNYDLAINNTIQHGISDTAYDSGTGPYHFDGYMAETHLFDGAVVAPSEFGETDTTGQWIPKEYKGTASYGTNGYYMPWKKNDRYSPYFNGNSSSGILTANHADFNVGSGNFTMECWFYVNEYAGNYRRVFGKSSSGGANADTEYQVDIDSSNQPVSYVYDAADNGATYLTLQSSTAITDNKWHHVALVRNGTAFNLYLDGTSVANATSSMTVNNSTYQFGIGRVGDYAGQIFNGWISNFRYVKGTAVYTSNFTPSTSPLTAITNTKLLCCQDATITTENSGTSKTLTVTAAQVTTHQMSPFQFDWYQDQSGQDNDYQPDNLTVNDVLLDSPTNNFPTLNPLMGNGASGITLSQGNLKSTQASLTSETAKVYSTMAFVSGKWYAEVACSTANVYTGHGVVNVSQSSEGFDFDSSTLNVSAFTWGDRIFKNGSQTQDSLNSTASDSNILGIALDLDNGTVQFYSNGSTSGSAETLTRNDGDLFVFCDAADSSGYASNSTYEWNFGQNGTHSGTRTAGGNADGNGIGNYMYSVPSGFLAPCSSNLATQTVKKPTDHFDIVLYTGNDSNRNITSFNFQPDLLWLKSRETAYHHRVIDSVRGSTRSLYSNENTTALVDDYGTVGGFLSNGFSLRAGAGSNATHAGTNANGDDMVAWAWKAGGATTTDVSESGSGTSRINESSRTVNTTAGFSIIKYVGSNTEISNGQHTKLNHGLSKAPDLVIIKHLEDTYNWSVMGTWMNYNNTVHGFNDLTLWLNDSAAAYGSEYMGTTDPDSTYLYLGNSNFVNEDGHDFICYAWHEIEGYSKFGTYEANNNASGPFINTGFTPSFVIFKYLDNNGEWWWMLDSTRDPYGNLVTEVLYANANSAESGIGGGGGIDILSNGFKIRGTNGGFNTANTYFYMAFAEFPFKYANAR